jgi:hypothetical protein
MTQPPRIITGDTDPANPVNAYDADRFPLGAAITVAYGSTTNMFCTLGNLYRILGYLDGPGGEGVPLNDQLDAMIDRYRTHVRAQLPGDIDARIMPPSDANDTERLLWLSAMHTAYGETITLTPAPSDDEGHNDQPTDLPGRPNN